MHADPYFFRVSRFTYLSPNFEARLTSCGVRGALSLARPRMAKERLQVGLKGWAQATANASSTLTQEACAEVAKPEWWNDEELKALSARVMRAAPDEDRANQMRAKVLSGQCYAWEAGPRSAAELSEAAKHLEVERLRLACCC